MFILLFSTHDELVVFEIPDNCNIVESSGLGGPKNIEKMMFCRY